MSFIDAACGPFSALELCIRWESESLEVAYKYIFIRDTYTVKLWYAVMTIKTEVNLNETSTHGYALYCTDTAYASINISIHKIQLFKQQHNGKPLT